MITVADAAHIKNVNERTIRKAIQRGDLSARKIGKRMLVIDEVSLEKWSPKNRGQKGYMRKIVSVLVFALLVFSAGCIPQKGGYGNSNGQPAATMYTYTPTPQAGQ